MAQPATAATLLGLPLELRNAVFEDLFCYQEFHAQMHRETLRMEKTRACDKRSCHHLPQEWRPPCLFSIQKTCHQLKDEVDTFMYGKVFTAKFNEETFCSGYTDQWNQDLENGERYWFSTPLVGFDEMKIQRILIDIEPSNFPGFWPCLRAALTTLCDDHLIHFEKIRELSLDMRDMAYSTWWAIYEDDVDEVYEPIEARLADYSTTLDIIEAVIRKADITVIKLPYWAEKHNGIDPLLKKWVDVLGARISFKPWRADIPWGFSVDEKDMSERAGFAELSDE